MPKYTVIAIYEDSLNRYAGVYEARDVPDAIAQAQAFADTQGTELLIAGVLEGDVKPVDTGIYGYDPD